MWNILCTYWVWVGLLCRWCSSASGWRRSTRRRTPPAPASRRSRQTSSLLACCGPTSDPESACCHCQKRHETPWCTGPAGDCRLCLNACRDRGSGGWVRAKQTAGKEPNKKSQELIFKQSDWGGYLLPSWKRANSSAVLSSTVRAVTVTGPLALLGKQPCSRTSCQSEWILQMSTESKYLQREMTAQVILWTGGIIAARFQMFGKLRSSEALSKSFSLQLWVYLYSSQGTL